VTAVLAPASTLDDERLAALFTGVYSGYWHPIEVDAERLRRMVATYDLDLDASVVALDGDDPVGVAVLGVRGDRGWVGGMGVLPERRGSGLGRLVTLGLLERARAGGLVRVRLEVLEQNAPAIAIYRALGFTNLGDVAVWQLGLAPVAEAAAEADVDDVLGELATAGADAPWQRSTATVARMQAVNADLRAARAADGAAVFAMGDGQATLLQLEAAAPETALSLIRTPFEHGATSLLWLNGPVSGSGADAMRAAGATTLATQHELEWRPTA
jgi:GNAT superfamily N-acetyltransferase